MRALHRTVLSLVAVAFVAAGCQSYAQLESNDPNVGEEEVFAAGQSGDTDHLDNLHHVLAHRDGYGPEVVAAALTSVGEMGDPSSVPYVVALRGDADEEIRWHVAAALKRLGGNDANAALADMAANDASELVREEAAQK